MTEDRPHPRRDRSPDISPTAAIVGLLALGLALQMFLWSRQWLYGDQYGLLLPAVEYIESGELAPLSKTMSGGGRIPGTLLQIVVAAPLRVWSDFRAPALLMGFSQLLAVGVLALVAAAVSGKRFAVFFVAVYWLTPWRLYHAGALWEPGFVLLPAALHLGCCWLLRVPAGGEPLDITEGDPRQASRTERWVGSFGLGAILLGTFQIHGSFLVLAAATALLLRKRRIRLQLASTVAGLVVSGTTLIPTIVAFADGSLSRVAPVLDQRVSLPVLIASNAAKAVSYWFRMGSADIGRRLRQTAWLADSPAGTEAAFPLPALVVSAVVVLSVASLLIALWANWVYLRGRSPTAAEGARRADTEWFRSYVVTMLSATVLTAAISPIPIQGWHVVIALHAACVPTAAWLGDAFQRGGTPRRLGFALITLFVLIAILIGGGHPTYLRPDAAQVERQDIALPLRPLIPPVR